MALKSHGHGCLVYNLIEENFVAPAYTNMPNNIGSTCYFEDSTPPFPNQTNATYTNNFQAYYTSQPAQYVVESSACYNRNGEMPGVWTGDDYFHRTADMTASLVWNESSLNFLSWWDLVNNYIYSSTNVRAGIAMVDIQTQIPWSQIWQERSVLHVRC